MSKTAIVIGATGATGRPLTHYLLDSGFYEQVIIFVRRPSGISHEKLIEHVVDFDQFETWQEDIQGDDLFSALGTTRKLAGSKEAQYRVDYSYQAQVIEAAAKNGVERLFLVSSPNARTTSAFFYSRMKAKLDRLAKKQSFSTKVFIKPSIIQSQRPDNRISEKLAADALQFAHQNFGLLSRYRPITADTLAKAIANCATCEPPLAPGTYHQTLDDLYHWV